MLAKVVVNDFQSVEKAELELGQITTIVGPSSTGKSALLRALNLLFRNSSSVPVRAQSKSKTTNVLANFNGTDVSVERGKSLSNYTLGEEKYTKSGVKVPEEVSKFLNLYSVSPDLHFAFQFDKPYLLDETGSTVSSVLGALTQASVLRGAAKEGNRRALEARRLVTTRTDDVAGIEAQLETDFSDIDALDEKYNAALELKNSAVENTEAQKKITSAISLTEEAQRRVDSLESVDCKDATDLLESLDKIIFDLRTVENAVLNLENAIEQAKVKHEVLDASAEISVLEEAVARYSVLVSSVSTFNSGMSAHAAAKSKVEQFDEKSKSLEAEIVEIEAKLPRCSECGQILDTEH